MQALWISCLFGLCLVPFGLSANECYDCIPGISGSDILCRKPVNTSSCSGDCLTISYKLKNNVSEVEGNLMMCGMGACEATGKTSCENAKNTQQAGYTVIDCTHKCCSGDLCNSELLYSTPTASAAPTTSGSNDTISAITNAETSPPSHRTPTSSAERGVARFGAIFAAFLLSRFLI